MSEAAGRGMTHLPPLGEALAHLPRPREGFSIHPGVPGHPCRLQGLTVMGWRGPMKGCPSQDPLLCPGVQRGLEGQGQD